MYERGFGWVMGGLSALFGVRGERVGGNGREGLGSKWGVYGAIWGRFDKARKLSSSNAHTSFFSYFISILRCPTYPKPTRSFRLSSKHHVFQIS